MGRLLVSFSGGETSAFMTQWILTNWRERYDEIKVVFANTGEENERTLEFVNECDRHFGFGVVWVEAVVQHGVRKDAKARIVTFETASRSGEPFEDMIKKYGIPNQGFKHCTRVLKLAPIYAHLADCGWKKGTFDVAIGIRADEIDRMSESAEKNRIVYPLVKLDMTKPKVNKWWAAQPFRLGLKGYQGNCKWCWKKSLRKHFTIMSEALEVFNFPARMEREYGHIGPEFTKHADTLVPGYRRVFFRKNQSTADIREQYEREKDSFIPAEDDAVVFDPDYDVGGGCEETCEVFADEDMNDAEAC